MPDDHDADPADRDPGPAPAVKEPEGTGPRGGRRRKPSGPPPRKRSSVFLLLALGAALVALLFLIERQFGSRGTAVDYNVFRDQVEAENVEEVLFEGDQVSGRFKRPVGPREVLKFRTIVTQGVLRDTALVDELDAQDVRVKVESQEIGLLTQSLLMFLPALLIVGLLVFFLRRGGGPDGGFLGGFTRSPAKRFRAEEKKKVTFKDVAGAEQAKAELSEIVEFLKSPEKFTRLGAEIPKGVLLMGSPGTGKTLLARAAAGEADVPFFSINGSEFIQMFVGVGASRVRDLFKTAKEASPCIVFIDEVDAVGRQRGSGVGGGHDEREQTLNQILGEMDGFTPTEAVIVIAATNRPDVLDPALMRPGRFDRHIQVDKPNRAGRLGILKVHTRNVPLGDDVDLNDVAAGTIGFSGAELKNLINEAALSATRAERNAVASEDVEEARDRVLMGAAREEVMNEHERRMTAFHEAGHALIAWLLPTLDPVHKVTIIPRGRALGVTQLLPEEERYHMGERKLNDHLAMAMGGRAAEKLVFDEWSAGAEDDLNRATDIARRMVAHWGMSEAIGPVAFRQGETHPFLGREMQSARTFSDETARLIDTEIQKVLTAAHDRATDLLRERRADLDRIAELLLQREALSRADMGELLGEREAHPDDPPRPPLTDPLKPHETNGQPVAVGAAAEV